jgi:hypothetical protein
MAGIAMAIVAGGVGLVAMVGNAQALDPRMIRCGVSAPGNEVAAVFEIDHARDFPKYFPNEKRRAPELERDSRALVVVFRGEVDLTEVVAAKFDGAGNRTPVVRNNVVCVALDPDAFPNDINLYYDVDLRGLRSTLP